MKTLAMTVAMTAALAYQPVAPLAGTWIAQFEGRTFVRLELKTVNGTITGGMAIGHFEVDGQGALRRAEESPRGLTPISDVTQHGSTVTFSRKDTTDTDRFELRMLEGGRAELHMLLSEADRKELAANGVPTPKPIPLTQETRDPRYIVTATPIALVGSGHPGLCLAIDPVDRQGVWWWEPGPSGCATRTTGPAVFRGQDATVVPRAGSRDFEIRFQLPLMSGTRDVRLVLQDGAQLVTASGAKIRTERRRDLEIPPAYGR